MIHSVEHWLLTSIRWLTLSASVVATLLISTCNGNTSFAPYVTIDGCQETSANVYSKVTILANGTTYHAQRPSVVKVTFIDCKVPNGLSIDVAIPTNNAAATNGVFIELDNVTMGWGSSIRIVPQTVVADDDSATNDSSEPPAIICNVRIVVNNSLISTSKDVLVIHTDGWSCHHVGCIAVRNVSIHIANSALKTTGGDVASFVGGKSVAAVHVRISGNTSLKGIRVASIVASNVANSSLVADSSSCRGPISISCITTSKSKQSGALSVFAMSSVSQLAVSDSNIAITDGQETEDDATGREGSLCLPRSANIHIVASGLKGGSTAIGSICNLASSATLVLSGNVSIQVLATRSPPTTNSGEPNNATQHNITIESTSRDAIVAVFGIALRSAKKSTIVLRDNCSLVLLLAVAELSGVHMKASVGMSSSMTILGISTLNGEVQMIGSNLTIALNGKGSISVAATTGKHYDLVASVMGIALNTVFGSSPTFSMFEGSNVVIAAAATPRSLMMVSQAAVVHSVVACPVLGISVNSWKDRRVTFFVDAESSISIVASVHGAKTNITSSSGFYAATTTLGIAVSSLHQTTTNMQLDGAIIIKAWTTTSALFRSRTASAKPSAVAILGLAVFSGGTARLTAGHDANFTWWVGAATKSMITIDGGSTTAAAVGVLGKFNGLHHRNVALGYCHDETNQVSSKYGAKVAVVPSLDGVVFNKTSTPSPQSEECDDQVRVINETLEFVLHYATHRRWFSFHHEPPPTPTASQSPSPTSSRSSSQNTFSHTPTVSVSVSISTTHSPSPTKRTPSKTMSQTNIILTPTLTTSVSTLVTGSQTPTLSTTLPLVPLTPPPPGRTRRVGVTTNIMLPGNEAAATVVLTSAGASTAVASTIGSGGAGVVVVTGSSVRMMECGLAEDDPKPAAFELPIQFAIGDGIMKYFAGAATAHSVLHAVLFIAPVFLRRSDVGKSVVGQEKRKQTKMSRFLSLFFCGAHGFFMPAVLGACSTVLNNDDSKASLIAAGFSGMIMIAIHVTVIRAVHLGPALGIVTKCQLEEASKKKTKFEFEVDEKLGNTVSGSPLLFSAEAIKDVLLTFFDGSRIYEKAIHRHYASIETTLFSVISIISGARPKDNCHYAAFAIGGIALSQLSYVALVRPFRTILDTAFSLVNNVLLVVLSSCVAVSLQTTKDTGDPPPEWALMMLERCLWLISAMGFVQLAVQGYWAYHVKQRRQRSTELAAEQQLHPKKERRTGFVDTDSETTSSSDPPTMPPKDTELRALSKPLLTVIEDTDSSASSTESESSSSYSSEDDEHPTERNPL